MIKHLLIGLDGSPTAEVVLPYVEKVAKATGATVTLVRVIAPEAVNQPLRDENVNLVPISVVMPLERPHAADEVARNEHYQAVKYLDSMVNRLGKAGVSSVAVVESGDPADVLLSEAKGRRADVIMLATHGRSGLGRLIYGSVADKILTHSPIPVFLARAAAAGQQSHFGESGAPFLVALDGTAESERALPLAEELAQAFSTSLALVEVVPVMATVMTPDGGWMTEMPMDIQVREEEIASDYLTGLSKQVRTKVTGVNATVRRDAIGVGIVAAAAESGASLIVMATHAPSGLVRALVGSVALDVLHRVTLPLLLVGPYVPLPTETALIATDRPTANPA